MVEELEIKVRFSAEGKECDEIQDLPKIAKGGRPLQILVTTGRWSSTHITIDPWLGTRWVHWYLTEEEAWSTFHKLQPLFQKRNRRWSTLLRSLPWWLSWPLPTAISVGVLELGFPFYKYELMPQGAAVAFVLLLCGIIIAAIVMGVRHTTFKLRHSCEPSPLRQYTKDKLVPVIVGTLFGVFGTLLVNYLRKKYWP